MKNLVSITFAAALTFCVPSLASATTLTAGFDSSFTSEVGVRFRSLGNTGADEVYLGVPDLGSSANRNAQQHTWVNGVTSFSFSIDLDNDLLTTSLGGGTPLTYSYAGSPTINALQVTIADRDTNGELWLTNLVVNGVTLGDVTNAANEGFEGFMVRGMNPASTLFTITGDINRSGTFGSSQELSRIEILAGSLPSPIPLPAAAWLLIAGLGGLAVMARRRVGD